MGNKTEILINLSGKKTFKYKDLPDEAKKSVDLYYKEELNLNINNDDVFEYSIIKTDLLKEYISVPNKHKNIDYLEDFDDYHLWYILEKINMIDSDEIWSLILSKKSEDIIEDGWFRLHSYVSKGIKEIPCVIRIN